MENPTPASADPTPPAGSDVAAAAAPAPAGGWAVAAGRGVAWWTDGWRLFTAAPVIWIVITLLYIALMFGLALIPFVGQVASSLLYPVLGAGVLLGTRALDHGGELTVGHLFACCNEKAVPLIVVALLYFAGWFVIWMIGLGLLIGLAGFQALSGLMSGDAMDAGMALFSGLGFSIVIVALVMALLAAPLIMAYWFAPALVVFRGDEPMAALKSSFAACMRNMPPFLVYSLIGIVVAVVASIPLLLGWIVLAPVYVATIYTSYKDIFGVPAA